MMSKNIGLVLTVLFGILAVATSSLLFHSYGFPAYIQTIAILFVAAAGEHFVSGKGYYHYTHINGVFIGRVPTWIPLLWVTVIQGSLIFPMILGINLIDAISISGLLCVSLDFYILEPLLSRKLGMWRWTAVKQGYFKFIPKQVNRFTAPFGNYLTWLIFPVVLNAFLRYMIIIPILL